METKKEKKKNIVMNTLVWPIESHIFLYLKVFIARSHWSDSRPLVSAIPLIMGSHWSSGPGFWLSWSACQVSLIVAIISSTAWASLPLKQTSRSAGSPALGSQIQVPFPHIARDYFSSVVLPRYSSGPSFSIAVGGIQEGLVRSALLLYALWDDSPMGAPPQQVQL